MAYGLRKNAHYAYDRDAVPDMPAAHKAIDRLTGVRIDEAMGAIVREDRTLKGALAKNDA